VPAVHEAAMNAVEHAYGPHAGTVELRVSRAGTRVEAEIRTPARGASAGERAATAAAQLSLCRRSSITS